MGGELVLVHKFSPKHFPFFLILKTIQEMSSPN